MSPVLHIVDPNAIVLAFSSGYFAAIRYPGEDTLDAKILIQIWSADDVAFAEDLMTFPLIRIAVQPPRIPCQRIG
jgi:hypothetical protein